MDALLHDVRHALRGFRHSPGFAIAAIVVMAIGMGGSTALLGALDALQWRELPVRNARELIWARGYSPQGQPRLTLITALEHLQRSEGPISDYCALNGGLVAAVEANGQPTQVGIDFVTAGCFELLGVTPALGRAYRIDEAPLTARSAQVALITHGFWQRMYGGDPGVLGRHLRMEGVQVEIIGVLPRGFSGLNIDGGAQIFAPFGAVVPNPAGRVPGATYVVGRLRPGASIEQAEAHLSSLWPAMLQAIVPGTLPPSERAVFLDSHVRVGSLATGFSALRDRYLEPLQISFALTVALLVLVSANLGGFLLVRLTARRSELVVRRALGATQWRLSQQLVAEGLLLAGAGTVLGAPLALGLAYVLESSLPVGLVERAITFSPSLRVFLAAAVGSLLTGAAISLVPILTVVARMNQAIAQWDRTVATSGMIRNRILIVGQVALCAVLMVGATLLSRSLAALHAADVGVHTDNVLSARLMPVPNGYQKFEAGVYYPEMLERIAVLPQVRSVGYSRMFPNLLTATPLLAPVTLVESPDREVGAQFDVASPQFYATVGMRIVRGRNFLDTDRAGAPPVVIVNESLARQLSGSEILGRRINYGTDPARQNLEIVGVVSNATLGSYRHDAVPIVYLSALQAGRTGYFPTLQIATTGDPLAIANEVRRIVREMGREHVVTMLTLDDYLAQSTSTERLAALVANLTASLAVTLAVIGIYALLAYTVSHRSRELGIRVALGARPQSIVTLVIRDAIVLTSLGIIIGIPLALWPAHALESLLFGVTPADPWTLAIAAVLLLAVGVAAGVLPAARAARADPIVALRAE
jgi:putative ABC transport system permease protein